MGAWLGEGASVIFFYIVTAGILSALTAWLINRLDHPAWLTPGRAVAAIVTLTILAGVVQCSSQGERNRGGVAQNSPLPQGSVSYETPSGHSSKTAAPTYLTGLEPVGGWYSLDEQGALDIDGTSYPFSVSFAEGSASTPPYTEKIEFALERRFSKFSVVLGLRDDAPETVGGPSACYWRIVADNEVIFAGTTWRGHHIVLKSRDISGVVHLALIATQTKGVGNPVPWPCTAGNPLVE